jgi:hypothetical protein
MGSVDQLKVALWPEYDRQAVLVMYRFRLRAGSQLPTTVALPIPASVGAPHAVAWQDESGGLKVAEFTRTVEDERATILINMLSLRGQLEFYADLTLEGPKRTFMFSWPGGVSMDTFSYKVQHPVGARRLEVIPRPDRQSVEQGGFTYEWIDHGSLAVSEKPAIELRYEKDSAALSVEALQQRQPSAPPQAVRQESPNEEILPPWLFGTLGGLVLGIAVSWFLWSSRRPPEKSQKTRGRKSNKKKTRKAGGQERRELLLQVRHQGKARRKFLHVLRHSTPLLDSFPYTRSLHTGRFCLELCYGLTRRTGTGAG